MRDPINEQLWSEAVWGLWPRYRSILIWSRRSRLRSVAQRVVFSWMRTHASIRYARAMARYSAT